MKVYLIFLICFVLLEKHKNCFLVLKNVAQEQWFSLDNSLIMYFWLMTHSQLKFTFLGQALKINNSWCFKKQKPTIICLCFFYSYTMSIGGIET